MRTVPILIFFFLAKKPFIPSARCEKLQKRKRKQKINFQLQAAKAKFAKKKKQSNFSPPATPLDTVALHGASIFLVALPQFHCAPLCSLLHFQRMCNERYRWYDIL